MITMNTRKEWQLDMMHRESGNKGMQER